MTRTQHQVIACPECGSHRVGRIANQQYYCGDCCIELVVRNGRVEVFEVDEDGNLTTVSRSCALEPSGAPN